MKDSCKQAEDFLNAIFNNTGLELVAKNAAVESGCLLNIDGVDSPLLRNQGGELLEALEQIINKIRSFNLPSNERIVCDVQDFRATREAELRAMAQHAAKHVRSMGRPFIFNSMNANERRVIHVTLADQDDLNTESTGEGNARQLVVSLKKPFKN